ncbi:MAG: DsbE family thiol:disulfide interchange protein [Cellvibrionaceae bacterium]|nr:DsbE family thiol:disulfide interchange protein [Cellvibrionaceae bacterium]
MNRVLRFLPLVLFMVLAVFFWRGLSLDPSELPSALIDQPFPEFVLPTLVDTAQTASRDKLIGDYTLVNIWATWCVACKVEHPFLNALAASGVRIVGVNWKDDVDAARRELADKGNPYQWTVIDADGRLSFDLGVYGAPETYLVDPAGIIRYKHVGILDEAIWTQKLLPIIDSAAVSGRL